MKHSLASKVLLISFFVCCFCGISKAQTAQFLDDAAEPATDITFQLKTASTGSLLVCFDYQNPQNTYIFKAEKSSIQFQSVINGTTHRLISASLPQNTNYKITIKRRPWLMQAIIDGKVLLTAYDATFDNGKIGVSASGWSWENPLVQPVDDSFYFADDFTRAPGENNLWKTNNGQWKLTSSSDTIDAKNQNMSANPFSYRVQNSSEAAFAQVGKWFWDDYEAQVSVKPESGNGEIGLACYVQDAQNYIAFRWDGTEGVAARQLVLVRNGKSTLLASAPGAFLPRQWYRLALRTSPGFVEAFIDGKLIFSVPNDAFGQGGIALLAQNTAANFDDVSVRSYTYFRQNFDGPTGGAWTPRGGFWKAASGILNSAPNLQQDSLERFLLAGRNSWQNYKITASGDAGDKGACGVIAGFADANNYLLFRWAGTQSDLPFRGRAQLVQVAKGATSIISDSALSSSSADGTLRPTIRFINGATTILLNNTIIAQTSSAQFSSGQPGLWADGKAVVTFQKVVIAFPPPAKHLEVAPRMAADDLMAPWATSAGEWPSRTIGKSLEFWNNTEFLGDYAAGYQWDASKDSGGVLEFALRANDGKFDSGYVMRFFADSQTFHAELLQNNTTLQSGQIPLPKTNTKSTFDLEIHLEGNAISATLDGQTVLAWLPSGNTIIPQGTHLAARSQGFMLRPRALMEHSSQRDDYTFSTAPVDWYSVQGDWNIFSRWPCYSDWSFFGGKGTAPVLWNKRTYKGDLIVEMFAHNQMNLPKEIGYSHPGDLNLTLCGDGKNPSSGYSFVIGGWYNTRSAILKNNTVVASSTAADAVFDKPTNEYNGFHRAWAKIRAEVRAATQNGQDGVLVKLTMDDHLLASYFDPAPLPAFTNGGRVAVWTTDSAIMLARVSIENQHPDEHSLPDGLVNAAPKVLLSADDSGGFAPIAITGDDGIPSAVVTPLSHDAWNITDPKSGGIFAVRLQQDSSKSPLRINAKNHLSFDLKMPAATHLDLYLTIDGTRYLVPLNGNQQPDASVPLLLQPAITSPNGWQHADVDFAKVLSGTLPRGKSWDLQKIEIGALHGDYYRWLGFNGNLLGSEYQLRNIALR
jgi:hypothetical protein